jgi:hypothetical protein
VCDIGTINHADLGELPSAIEAVEQANSVSRQQRDNMQLQFVDQPGGQGLPRDIAAAPDGCVAVASRLLRRIDGGCDAFGDEDKSTPLLDT